MLKLTVYTPLGVILDLKDLEFISVPGVEGAIGVMSGHVPLITTIHSGILNYRGKDAAVTGSLALHHGFLEVYDDNVKICSVMAERPEKIDLARAQNSYESTLKEIDELFNNDAFDSNVFNKLDSKYKRAITRINTIKT